jgi:hypothetical protein
MVHFGIRILSGETYLVLVAPFKVVERIIGMMQGTQNVPNKHALKEDGMSFFRSHAGTPFYDK